MNCPSCQHELTLRHCTNCGALAPEHVEPKELSLIDWLASKKLQRRLSAGLWGVDRASKVRFPDEDKPYEPAAKPIIPMPPNWYEKS